MNYEQKTETGSEKWEFFENAVDYVKANKEIMVPAENVPEGLRGKRNWGVLFYGRFEFIDDEGNLAGLDVNCDKIQSVSSAFDEEKRKDLAGYSFGVMQEEFANELGKNGFTIEKNFEGARDALERFSKAEEEYTGLPPQTKKHNFHGVPMEKS